jgi:hypothetical protein
MPFRYKVAEHAIDPFYLAIEPKPCDILNVLALFWSIMDECIYVGKIWNYLRKQIA